MSQKVQNLVIVIRTLFCKTICLIKAESIQLLFVP